MMRCRPWFLLLLSVCAPIPAVGAEKPVVSPDEIPGTTKVDAERVLQLVQQLPQLVIIDSRIVSDRLQGYIEDSVSLPDIKTDCKSLKKIVADRSVPLLFYCNGPKCGRSAKAAQKAVGCGYTRLYWFRGGFEEWRAKDYPVVKDN